ncbi:MAG: hypothetical protein M9927_15865 [Anaerolineae bacterium]|nr:hypothetical protein [Anaerolineae bacterium]
MRVLVSTIGSRGDVQPLVAQPLVTPSGLTWRLCSVGRRSGTKRRRVGRHATSDERGMNGLSMNSGEALPGGNMSGVWRIGDTVRREAGPWTPQVHRLLEHLRSQGITFVPSRWEWIKMVGRC